MPAGTYLVTAAEGDSAVLRDVDSGQVHTLADPPELDEGDVLEATVAAEPPLEITYRLESVEERRLVAIEDSEMAPTQLARELAADAEDGEVVRQERAGEGELHVLAVPPERTDAAAQDVLDDEETLARAARLGVDRVEVRSGEGVVSVRYLP